MSDPGSQLKALFLLVAKPFRWFLGQFEDTALIGLAILGAGVLFLGGMFVVGHWAPVKTPVVNTEHVYNNAYNNHQQITGVHEQYPQHLYVHPSQLTYPQNSYHRPHHVYSHSYQNYGHHMATVSNTTPDSSSHINTHQVHSTRNTPYARHRFGAPRGSSASFDESSYDFNLAGGAHAHQ